MNPGNTAVSCPRLYVGTYEKYAAGSIKGAWLDLEDYPDRDSFLKACAKLHPDEADPEFMFQDFEGFPRSFYSESSVSDDLWEWLGLDDDDRQILEVYRGYSGDSTATIEDAREHFHGRFSTVGAWAEAYLEESGILSRIPDDLRRFFDVEAYAREAEVSGDLSFIEHEGEIWVFWP